MVDHEQDGKVAQEILDHVPYDPSSRYASKDSKPTSPQVWFPTSGSYSSKIDFAVSFLAIPRCSRSNKYICFKISYCECIISSLRFFSSRECDRDQHYQLSFYKVTISSAFLQVVVDIREFRSALPSLLQSRGIKIVPGEFIMLVSMQIKKGISHILVRYLSPISVKYASIQSITPQNRQNNFYAYSNILKSSDVGGWRLYPESRDLCRAKECERSLRVICVWATVSFASF